ncbi:phosphopantetheine-binding protein [Ferruginivarius sediminum]|uniref:phosphopantetheine-binding protein n=1 Tax=Ferruginivarius sediminum TaxID=2661937 RepID=UPI00240CFED9|nr:phosphopantetheine-binding protein [Ferruginivarius sediminum]
MAIDHETAREALRQAVSKVLEEDTPPLEDGMNMFEDLRMDSTTMLETLMELEETLQFDVDPEELDIEDFLTVGAYVKFLVEVKQQQA